MPAAATTHEPLDPTRLQDPVYVFQAMQRGQIAMLSPMHVSTLYEKPIGELLVRQAEAAHGAQIAIMESNYAMLESRIKWMKRARTILLALCSLNLGITLPPLIIRFFQ